jgi:hypothetical protein
LLGICQFQRAQLFLASISLPEADPDRKTEQTAKGPTVSIKSSWLKFAKLGLRAEIRALGHDSLPNERKPHPTVRLVLREI